MTAESLREAIRFLRKLAKVYRQGGSGFLADQCESFASVHELEAEKIERLS